jgi:dTMP kinase
MKKAIYICIEGVEGVGKTTQIQLLKEYLENKGDKVLVTKEPGTDRVPITMQLRSIVNDGKNEHLFKGLPRELILQAIRGTHLNSDVYPNMSHYDYIIQDRGIISGLAYGDAFGLSTELMMDLNNKIVSEQGVQFNINNSFDIYDHILFFNSEMLLSH